MASLYFKNEDKKSVSIVIQPLIALIKDQTEDVTEDYEVVSGTQTAINNVGYFEIKDEKLYWTGPGVTLTAKNWYGATDINLQWRKNAHIGFSADKRHGTPSYKTFVDFIGHKDLGGKTLLYLIDGTYGSRDVNGKPAPKWQKPPFNNEWACSLIASQDALACDAVAMDLLISEWPEFGSFNYCDEYLLEASTIPNTNSGSTYDPERDGKPLTKPLGIFEHCDSNRKYTKIDLQYKLMK